MRPSSELELAEMIRGARRPLFIRGGGTRVVARAAGDILETGGLSGITLYEPGALTLVAQAGTPVADVEAVLAAENQRLAFEVPDMRGLLGRHGTSTIGGVVADNASGPRRVQVGACRDSLIGVRLVDGQGMVIKNGGRVMKNVTGYDLVKLVAGSRGTLGVLSEVSFKLQAKPEAEATLRATGLVPAEALTALRRALGSPYDISGAAHLDAASAGGASQTLIRIEGLAGSVAYRAAELTRLLGDCEIIHGQLSAEIWHRVRDVAPFVDRPGAVWRLSVTPSKAMEVPSALTKAGVAHESIWDWGGGRLWLLVQGAVTPLIRAAVIGIGHATLIRPNAETLRKDGLAQEAPAIATLTAGLRAAFDPRGILNTAEA